MPRLPRVMSESGYYHVTMRGNAKGLLFENEAHRRKFLDIVRTSRDELGYTIIAWCLMDNHVHFVLNVGESSLSKILHVIGTSYAVYFNRSEERSGHVFQCPFGSKPIEYDNQLINTVRYVHMNPERAFICPQEEYPWSSYSEYADTPDIVDVNPVFGIAGGKSSFLSFSLDEDYVVRLPVPAKKRTSDEAVKIAIMKYGQNAISLLQAAKRQERDKAIVFLWGRGISAGQIGRMCAVSERTVRRIINDEVARVTKKQLEGKRIGR